MKTADEYIRMQNITEGDFDNVGACKYNVPDYWTIGEVYKRLIEDVQEGDVERSLWFVDQRCHFQLQYGFFLSVQGIYP